MTHRNKEGATLALTVTGVFFIILLGVGFFFLVQLLGGGREAQHATDAGNLNVAKGALIKPAIPASADDLTEFEGLYPSTGNNIDLVDYNRFVGKAFLMAMNASEENTQDAYNNANNVLKQVEGANGIGQRLCTQLSSAGQTEGFFAQLASSNSLRMLNWNNQNQISNDQTAYKVGFMRQNAQAPTNLLVFPNSLPAGQVSVPAGDYKVPASDGPATNLYLVGYTPVTVKCGGFGDLVLYGVPVRPNQQPHLVAQEDFAKEFGSPLQTGGNSLLPPNAFQSQSSAGEMHGGNVFTRSSAIVGSLGLQYDAAIPHGFIVVDNTGVADAISYSTDADIFGGELMNGVYMVPAGIATEDPGVFQRIKDTTPDSNGDVRVSPADKAALHPGGITQTQLNQLHDYLQTGSSFLCNNRNSFTGHPVNPPVANDEPTNPDCVNALLNHQALVNSLETGGGGATGGGSDLMALEFMKAEVIRIRGEFGDDGCGTIQPPKDNITTGLKKYPHSGVGNDVHFGTPGTLWDLVQQTRLANDTSSPTVFDRTVDGIIQRMQEMNPRATKASLDPRVNPNVAPWNTVVSFNSKTYIWYDKETTAFQMSPSPTNPAPPPFPHSFEVPDGPTLTQFSQVDQLSDIFVNLGGDGGFPHPFDCPPDFSGFTKDTCDWKPSTGFHNLLGVIRFSNQAKAGATWCCPC